MITNAKVPTVYCDGASEGNGSELSHAYGSYKIGSEYPERVELAYGATNNEAEYETLIAALKALRERGIQGATIYMDSKLVVEQMAGRWRVKAANIAARFGEAKRLLLEGQHKLIWVPRDRIVAVLGH